jgi:Growth inhibitor
MNGEVMIKRGELYYADLSPVVGSEQGGVRPVLIVQNDIGNKFSPTVIAAAITSQLNKAKLPTHIELGVASGLPKDSVVLLEQIRTIDKQRLQDRIGEVGEDTMKRVNNALMISLGFFYIAAFSFQTSSSLSLI